METAVKVTLYKRFAVPGATSDVLVEVFIFFLFISPPACLGWLCFSRPPLLSSFVSAPSFLTGLHFGHLFLSCVCIFVRMH